MLPSYLPGLPHPFLCIFGILAISHEPPHWNARPGFHSKALCEGFLVVFRSLAFHGAVATLFVFLYYLGILAIFPEPPPQFAWPIPLESPSWGLSGDTIIYTLVWHHYSVIHISMLNALLQGYLSKTCTKPTHMGVGFLWVWTLRPWSIPIVPIPTNPVGFLYPCWTLNLTAKFRVYLCKVS